MTRLIGRRALAYFSSCALPVKRGNNLVDGSSLSEIGRNVLLDPLHLPALHKLLPLARRGEGRRGRNRRHRGSCRHERGCVYPGAYACAPRSSRALAFGKRRSFLRVARGKRLPPASRETTSVPCFPQRVEFSRLA